MLKRFGEFSKLLSFSGCFHLPTLEPLRDSIEIFKFLFKANWSQREFCVVRVDCGGGKSFQRFRDV
jgi:hypothetical protein